MEACAALGREDTTGIMIPAMTNQFTGYPAGYFVAG